MNSTTPKGIDTMELNQRRCFQAETTRDCSHSHDWVNGKAFHGPWTQLAISRDRIRAAYAVGDITEGQRLNRETGVALGGSVESGGAVKS